jgi:pimeloyl-ACP methyl ester carboxylesterase
MSGDARPVAGAGHRRLTVDGGRLDCLDLAPTRPGRPALLLMHEGLGSVQHWRAFPAKLAAATGCRTVAYSRSDFGRSDPRRRPYSPRFMHEEAHEVMPDVREQLGLERLVLVGHSTGASMSLIHAAAGRWPVDGVVAMAPISFIEESNLDSIRRARSAYGTGRLRESLARYHDDVDRVFYGWADTWLAPAFRHWSLEPDLPAITCPILAIRGGRDEYVTEAQIDAIERLACRAPRVDRLLLAGCGHAPHRDQPQAVIEAIGAFLDRPPQDSAGAARLG